MGRWGGGGGDGPGAAATTCPLRHARVLRNLTESKTRLDLAHCKLAFPILRRAACAARERRAALDPRQGAQPVVRLLPSTQPETIEQFGIRVAEAWKPGRQGIDDGL
ncbi:MAG: hypothetical protein ACK56I_12475, partial [bacterium]